MFHLLFVMPLVSNYLCTGYNEITVHNYIFCGKETNAQTCCPTSALTLTAMQALAATKIVNVCNDVNATATATITAATARAATATATLSATAFGHEKCSADNWKSSAWKSLAPFSGFV